MSDSGRLAGKVAVIVGAGQTPGEGLGNGRATALRFAEEGARLVLVDRRRDSAEETAAMARERAPGCDCLVLAADITREDECAGFVADSVARFGRIDVLHNNVGIGRGDAGPSHVSEAAM